MPNRQERKAKRRRKEFRELESQQEKKCPGAIWAGKTKPAATCLAPGPQVSSSAWMLSAHYSITILEGGKSSPASQSRTSRGSWLRASEGEGKVTPRWRKFTERKRSSCSLLLCGKPAPLHLPLPDLAHSSSRGTNRLRPRKEATFPGHGPTRPSYP